MPPIKIRLKVLPVICITGILLFIIISWVVRRGTLEDWRSMHNYRMSKAQSIASLLSQDSPYNRRVVGVPRFSPDDVPVFYKGLLGYNTSRIPALVYKDGIFVAFCEARKDTDMDIGNMDIISRRGKRSGSRIIWDKPTVVASIPGSRVMNPTPIVDKVRNTIVLVFISLVAEVDQHDVLANGTLAQGLHFTKTSDYGLTWSKPVNLSSSILLRMKFTPLMFATGPGHGIQLSSGRLIVPANTFYKDKRGSYKQKDCLDHSLVLYSDDGGDNWNIGGSVPVTKDSKGYIILTNEVQAVELDDHVVCLNSRTLSSFQTRAISCSYDGGLTFKPPDLIDGLIEPGFKYKMGLIQSGNFSGCQASMIGFPAPPGTVFNANITKRWVLFSNPADVAERKDTSIRISKDGLKTWSEPWTINYEAGAYSDMTYFEAKEGFKKVQKFGILYERGHRDAYEAIVFRTFTLNDVIKGVQ
ncbi:sialidase-3-like isoform X2 [Ptychodera flava]